jgi:hypothetical protein
MGKGGIVPPDAASENRDPDVGTIVVVSGLPRSGTSMAMAMLAEGGLPCLVDGVRQSDEDNPKGYYEFEMVKSLGEPEKAGWLEKAGGKAIKIVSPLLKSLPGGYSYRVLFMLRDLDEVLASQKKMMVRSGDVHEVPNDQMKAFFRNHLEEVDTLLANRRDVAVKYIDYRTVITRSREMAEQISEFLGLDLDVDRMAAAVDGRLYRNRSV